MLYCQSCICWWLKKTGNFVFLWEKKPHTHPLSSTTPWDFPPRIQPLSSRTGKWSESVCGRILWTEEEKKESQLTETKNLFILDIEGDLVRVFMRKKLVQYGKSCFSVSNPLTSRYIMRCLCNHWKTN